MKTPFSTMKKVGALLAAATFALSMPLMAQLKGIDKKVAEYEAAGVQGPQLEKIREILVKEDADRKALSAEEKKEKGKELAKISKEKIAAIITPEQAAAVQKNRKANKD